MVTTIVMLYVLGLALIALARRLSRHYVLTTFGDRIVLTYGVFQTAGHVVGLSVFLALTPPHLVLRYLVCTTLVFFPAAALMARVVCGITDHWPKFRAHPIQFVLSAEKFSAFGGVIGGVGGFLLCNLWLDMGFGLWAIDAFAPALIAGEIVSRFGCHANGCCYGRRLTEPLGRGTISVKYFHPLQKAVWHGGHGGSALYAAPIYQAVANLTLLAVLAGVAAVRPVPAGFIGGLGLLLYPYCRSLNEMLRADFRGFGQAFNFYVLAAFLVAGLVTITQAMAGGPGATFEFRPANLLQPWVLAGLAFNYALLFPVYAISVQFRRTDLPAFPRGTGGELTP